MTAFIYTLLLTKFSQLVDGKPQFFVMKPERVSELLAEGKRIKEEEEAAEKAKKEEQIRARKAVAKDDGAGSK